MHRISLLLRQSGRPLLERSPHAEFLFCLGGHLLFCGYRKRLRIAFPIAIVYPGEAIQVYSVGKKATKRKVNLFLEGLAHERF